MPLQPYLRLLLYYLALLQLQLQPQPQPQVLLQVQSQVQVVESQVELVHRHLHRGGSCRSAPTRRSPRPPCSAPPTTSRGARSTRGWPWCSSPAARSSSSSPPSTAGSRPAPTSPSTCRQPPRCRRSCTCAKVSLGRQARSGLIGGTWLCRTGTRR